MITMKITLKTIIKTILHGIVFLIGIGCIYFGLYMLNSVLLENIGIVPIVPYILIIVGGILIILLGIKSILIFISNGTEKADKMLKVFDGLW